MSTDLSSSTLQKTDNDDTKSMSVLDKVRHSGKLLTLVLTVMAVALMVAITLTSVHIPNDKQNAAETVLDSLGSVTTTQLPTRQPTTSPTAAVARRSPTVMPSWAPSAPKLTTPDELRQAVIQYTTNPSPHSIVAQTYGYPIGTW